jgi:probable HAF family extracellular repeat protein
MIGSLTACVALLSRGFGVAHGTDGSFVRLDRCRLIEQIAASIVLGLTGIALQVSTQETEAAEIAIIEPDIERPYAVSADGLTVVGSRKSGAGFRWTWSDGMTLLPSFDADNNGVVVTATSNDGSVASGSVYGNALDQVAALWDAGGHAQSLGVLPGRQWSQARDISGAGNVVIGTSHIGQGDPGRAFRWTAEEGLRDLGSFFANAIADDGRVIAGTVNVGMSPPIRWTEQDGIMQLGTIPGTVSIGSRGISADGSVIMGDYAKEGWTLNDKQGAWRWTKQSGIVDLGIQPGMIGSFPKAITADGSTIIGHSRSNNDTGETNRYWYRNLGNFLWDSDHGMRDLMEVLEQEHGIDFVEALGSKTIRFYDMSADGKTLVGKVYDVTSGSAYCDEARTLCSVFALRLDRPLATPIPPGDFNTDGMLDVTDIDALTAQVLASGADLQFDVNDDGIVSDADRTVWVHDVKRTWFGDANLDGEFNTGDLVQVFEAGRFELDLDASWAEGDWNGDGRFAKSDLVSVFQEGGYEQGPRAAAAAVPEPAGWLLAIAAASMRGLRRTRRRRSAHQALQCARLR